MTDASRKAGLANLIDVVLSCDDTSKRVTVKCGRRVVVKLRGDIARMFGFLNDTTIRVSDKKGFLPYPKLEINIFTFIRILSRVSIMVMLLFPFFVLLQ